MTNKDISVYIYNSYTGQKETLTPLIPGHIGMYVCGPTVYNDAHLGNCRTFVGFDLVFRFLKYLGYKVRYVRNITDVGHLVGDVDTGSEDKIGRMARLEQLEPMEIAQRYTNSFHRIMKKLNTLDPSIEPTASGHIIEQQIMVQEILDHGLAYEMNGSVYFDTIKFAQQTGEYGKLSGRVIDDLLAESRDNLKNQDEKRHPSDFAIWIKADENHIMRWPSKWSEGFPGWHLECSAMSTKYLGNKFDIHGGGQDLKFPHHENEIAQNFGACGSAGANIWMHANMLLLNGKKMSKSEGNSILPDELFNGHNDIFEEAFDPMTVRFFMIQSHYRSTLDLTLDNLQAASKGLRKIREANKQLKNIQGVNHPDSLDLSNKINALTQMLIDDLADDFNTPKLLSTLYEIVTIVNSLANQQLEHTSISQDAKDQLHHVFEVFVPDVLGLTLQELENSDENTVDGLMDIVLKVRSNARSTKDWTTSDMIRDKLAALNIQVKDGKENATYEKIK